MTPNETRRWLQGLLERGRHVHWLPHEKTAMMEHLTFLDDGALKTIHAYFGNSASGAEGFL